MQVLRWIVATCLVVGLAGCGGTSPQQLSPKGLPAARTLLQVAKAKDSDDMKLKFERLMQQQEEHKIFTSNDMDVLTGAKDLMDGGQWDAAATLLDESIKLSD